MDLPGWQAIYEELKDKNFEIIAAAQDTAGEEASGKFYDRAKATYTTLNDPQHTVSSLYNMINVPTGVWIDEEGRIVRPPEVAYSKEQEVLGQIIGNDRYIEGLYDWVENGSESKFVVPTEELTKQFSVRDPKLRLADTHFKLAVYYHGQDDEDAAAEHWQQAQRLNPNSWNYHRQQWSFQPKTAMKKWFKKFKALDGKPYYAPIDLPTEEE